MPHNLAVVLHAARVLLGYGRHLIDTVRQRAAAPNFEAIAATFGTANLATILEHLNRGIQRAIALERYLLARAATGRDIGPIQPRPYTPRAQPAPTDTQAARPAPPPAPRKPPPVPTRRADGSDPGFFMPTPEELDRQVRRRPIGLTITDICRDLAIDPKFCTVPFWNDLLTIILRLGGNLTALMEHTRGNEKAFDKQEDRKRGRNWDWLTLKRDGLRQVLGFFIGEPPVNPFDPDPIATGPP
jgi:hypothetical protein